MVGVSMYVHGCVPCISWSQSSTWRGMSSKICIIARRARNPSTYFFSLRLEPNNNVNGTGDDGKKEEAENPPKDMCVCVHPCM